MQHTASQGQSQGKRSPVVAGIGAAVVAATVVVMMSSSPKVSTTGQGTSVASPSTASGCQSKAIPSQPARQGQIIGFLSTEQANSVLERTQSELGMAINPDYLTNVRSLVHLDGAAQGSWQTVLVPNGMNVRIGDRVEVIGARLDLNLPCHYIPNIITRDLSQ